MALYLTHGNCGYSTNQRLASIRTPFRTHKSECTDTCNRLHTEYEDYIHNQTQFNPKYSNEWDACNCDVSLL